MISSVEQNEFWRLIEVMGGTSADEDFERLTDVLAGRDVADIIEFEDELASLLYALDTRAHAKAARARGDWFLYVRCAAVCAGRSVYREILEDPRKLSRFARREAELILTVAPKAYERISGKPWQHESPIAYESGSNVAGWGGPDKVGGLPLWIRMAIIVVRVFHRAPRDSVDR
jgi:hypothetical protein